MINKRPESFSITILGASGDLAKLKIFPSLFALVWKKHLPEKYAVLGYARSEKDQEMFKGEFALSVQTANKKHWNDDMQQCLDMMLEHVYYYQGQYDKVEDYNRFGEWKDEMTGMSFEKDVVMFSVTPKVFCPAIEAMHAAESLDNAKLSLVIEKPFGGDTASAQSLFHTIGNLFDEDQVYLLDHYLGKHEIRSIMPLRHNNRLLSLALQGNQISNIQITVTEPFGVETRLGYFDEVGIIKDMIQSHLLQILGLITMSIPIEKNAQTVREEKSGILSSLHFVPKKEHVSIGQYEGYCDGKICSPKTPTFAAVRMQINRERWYNVPILIRTGKCIGERKESYVTVELKKFAFQEDAFPTNKIVFEFAPVEQLHIKLYNESSGKPVAVHAAEALTCDADCLPEHGRLLLDVLEENQMYFVSFKEIIASWKVVDEVLKMIQGEIPEKYAKGSLGPKSQNAVVDSCKYTWHELES